MHGVERRSESLLKVRLKADNSRRATLLLFLFAVVAFGVGFVVRRFGT